jgi:SAM-dependent methyltransferase
MPANRRYKSRIPYTDSAGCLRELLEKRGDAQLRHFFNFVRTHYPDGRFTLLDVGCGPAVLTRKIAQNFPESRIVGVDLDDSENYAVAWRDIQASTPNIGALLRGNMLDIDYLRHAFEDCLNTATIDIVFGHASVMYLYGQQLQQFLHNFSAIARWIFLRDTPLGPPILQGNQQVLPALQRIRRLYVDLEQHCNGEGAHVGPLTPLDVEGTAFDLGQFADYEIYRRDGDDQHSLEEYMSTLWRTLPAVLHGHKPDSYLRLAEQACDEFGQTGDSLVRLYLISILQNPQL